MSGTSKGKKRKKRRETLPILTHKLDKIFSRYIRLQSASENNGCVPCFTCQHVGEVKTMQAGHWIPRQHKSTRWSEWNVWPQCYACNMHYGGRPQEYREQLVEIYGEEEVQAMAQRRHEIQQWTHEELKDMIEDYTERVQVLEAAM